MNCQQCDNRIQQSLDERNNPRLDPEIRDHVSQCASCLKALDLYLLIDGSLSESAPSAGDLSPSPSGSRVLASDTREWRRGYRDQGGSRMPGSRMPGSRITAMQWLPGVVAALLLLGCFLVLNRPTWRERSPSARMPETEVSHVDLVRQSAFAQRGDSSIWFDGQSSPRAYRLSELLQRDLAADYVNSFANSLNFDPLELVPAEPVRTVQSFPRALASIAPWYQYSGEFPLLGRWVNGVHCTLGILELSIPSANSTPKVVLPPDLGGLLDFDRSATC